MTTAKIRFETNGSPRSQDWRLYLNDVDISRYVRSITVYAGVGMATRADISLAACEIEMPDDLPLELGIKE